MLTRCLAILLLAAVAMLRVGGPSACVCTGEFGAFQHAHVESTHEHDLTIGCDGRADACSECHRCQAGAPPQVSVPRSLEAQRHPVSHPSIEFLQALAAVWTSDSSRGSAEQACTRDSLAPVRPPPGVAIVRVTVLIV